MKKKPGLELKLADVNGLAVTPAILAIFRWAALARARRMDRSPLGKKVRSLGYPPNPDSWRAVVRRFLRRRLPWAVIHVGGHHVAIHDGMGRRGGDYGQCLARIVEVTPV